MIACYYTLTVVCINTTHRAADDVVLIWVPTDVPHTGVMTRQSGDHAARQYIINCTYTNNWRNAAGCRCVLLISYAELTGAETSQSTQTYSHGHTHWWFFQWSSQSRWTSAQCWTLGRNGSGWVCAERRDHGTSSLRCRLLAYVSLELKGRKEFRGK